jgi:hypothetical protein
MLEFDEQSHTYRLDGADLPSVTQAICEAGLVDIRWFTEYSRWRGSAVHLACWFDDQNDLDESTVEPSLMGYVEAYRRFRENYQFETKDIEARQYHPVFRYAGTPDRVGIVRGNPAIVDLKSGVALAGHPVQLASYAHLPSSLNLSPYDFERVAVYLQADGTYKVKSYSRADLANDWNVFLAALYFTNWKRSHKIGERAWLQQ